jgi:hypothetical protein
MKVLRSLIATGWLIALSSAAASADPSPEWFGTWHLDVERSTFLGPAPYVRGTWKVSPAPGGEVMMIYDQVGTRGGVTHMEWRGPFDGSDRRLHGPDAVVTYAYSEIDERTLNLLVKVDQRPTATARVVLSPDGTVTATATNSTARGPVTTVTVYRKR